MRLAGGKAFTKLDLSQVYQQLVLEEESRNFVVPTVLDDILITGPTEKAHLATLEEVLQRFEEAGLRHRREKCVFLAPSVVYLGHVIDSQGLHPTQEKVRAVQEASRPENVAELKSWDF